MTTTIGSLMQVGISLLGWLCLLALGLLLIASVFVSEEKAQRLISRSIYPSRTERALHVRMVGASAWLRALVIGCLILRRRRTDTAVSLSRRQLPKKPNVPVQPPEESSQSRKE